MEYRVIGMMSGTSLDGLDLCYCKLSLSDDQWKYQILHAETMPYSGSWTDTLKEAVNLSSTDLLTLNHEYGLLLAEYLERFRRSHAIAKNEVDLVASHGHTCFHQPHKGFTYQLGGGPELSSQTGFQVVSDFRSQDVALGGQGAPLVPIGDALLFGGFRSCMNLGGFANISFDLDGERRAFDICPVNFVLNPLARQVGQEYDAEGRIAASNPIDQTLLDSLNELEFYREDPPKSLAYEWVEQYFWPQLAEDLPPETAIATLTEHAAVQISRILNHYKLTSCLLTGGGTFNSHLISRVEALTSCELIRADKELIEFKEALVFALLGVLRIREENNVLASVTGARRNHCSGIVYQSSNK